MRSTRRIKGLITIREMNQYLHVPKLEPIAPISLSESDLALLNLIDKVSINEADKIKQLKFLVQECKANINAGVNKTVLWKAIESDSPALVSTVIELGADLQRIPRRHNGEGKILSHTVRLYKPNTHKIIEALCMGGADIIDGWRQNIFPPHDSTVERKSYYDNIKTLLKYSVNIQKSLLDEPFYIFVSFMRYDKDQSNQKTIFEIIKMFIVRGADLFYASDITGNTALYLIKKMIHERGELAEVHECIMHINPIENRLNVMAGLSALTKKQLVIFESNHCSSLHMSLFSQLLDQAILAINQIRTVSRLFAQGVLQENNNLRLLCADLLFLIASQSAQNSKVLPEHYARNIAHTFFARPPSAYTDGYSPLPLALRYDK